MEDAWVDVQSLSLALKNMQGVEGDSELNKMESFISEDSAKKGNKELHKMTTCIPEEDYLKFFTVDDNDDSFNLIIDTQTQEQRLESQLFDQKKVLTRLIKTAGAQRITPHQLYSDIKTLIFAESQFSHCDSAGDIIKTMLDLKKKYSVDANASDTDSITMFRLKIMFPQYSCMVADEILSHRIATFIFGKIETRNCSSTIQACANLTQLKPARSIMEIPSGMKTFAFASAIPTKAVGVLTEESRQDLIIGYLAYQILLNRFVKKLTPFSSEIFHSTLVATKHQIKNGLLTNKQRLRVLLNMGVVFLDGQIDAAITDAIDNFKKTYELVHCQINYDIVFSYPKESVESQGEEKENNGNIS